MPLPHQLADMVAADPSVEIVEDERERYGYLLVRCPHDDGTDDHALHVCNARDALPAHAYCLSEKCKDVTATEFVKLLAVNIHVL